MKNEPLEVTLKVTRLFEELEIPYLIGGSMASILYGLVRTTQDADIVAQMQLEHLPQFLDALQDEFYIDEEMAARAIQDRTSFNIIKNRGHFCPLFFCRITRWLPAFFPVRPRGCPPCAA